jgi:ABC-2 type transport system permease protein
MTRVKTLSAIELRLLVRDPTLVVFAFAFAPFVMLILAGVFGTHPNAGYGMARPDHYYVAASTAVPTIALALIGLPVTLASHRERGVVKRFEAFGISTTALIAAEALVTAGLVAVTTTTVLAVAAPTYGVPAPAHLAQTIVGLVAATTTLTLIGLAVGLAAPTARAAQAIGLLAFFPLYLLGGGGPPTRVLTGPLHTIANALPSGIQAITDPWVGISGYGQQLITLAIWAAIALAAIAWLLRRRP